MFPTNKMSRRELLQCAGAAGTALSGFALPPTRPRAEARGPSPLKPAFEWIRTARLLIGEGYAPPFYPPLDYDPEKALAIAQRLNCDSFRYPTYSYVAFFPTKAKFPRHPELGDRDPFRRTVELFHGAGLKVVAYNPLNHPFMDIRADNPEYRDWMRYDAAGRPMITRHMGWTRFYEGCLNSPLRDQIRERIREVVTNYAVDLMYFDGPYEGMEHAGQFCHCRYCKAAYQKARGKEIPLQDGSSSLDDLIEYREWLADDVVGGFMHEICDLVRAARDVPIIYNDTGLLGKDWRARAYRYVDGFMFEAADTPEQKLFNMRLGQSTGKVIWTYVSSHTEYNREHLKNKTVRGWYSYPVAGERLLLDAAVATAAGAGYCYWGLNRLFYAPADNAAARIIRTRFDFSRAHEALLGSLAPVPQAAILTGTQTIKWYQGSLSVHQAYGNYYYGAWQLLKDIGYDAEPMLDYEMAPERLAKFRLVYAPNLPCLTDGQCSALAQYVEQGGTLVATHLTSLADEYGRPRNNYGLSEIFGATAASHEPVEIPDLYLRVLPSRRLIPQDPQIVPFTSRGGAEVLAETYSRGERRALGPAVIRRRHGRGQVIYIGSGLEAVYQETLNGALRRYFRSLVDPVLDPVRSYAIEYRAGLMAEFAASPDTLALHLLANTGNIWKKFLVQEEFLPVENVRVRIRLPAGRKAKSVALMWSGKNVNWSSRAGWVELVVPQVRVYEAVRVDLA